MTDPLLFLQVPAAGLAGITQQTMIGAAIVVFSMPWWGGRVYCSWVTPVNIVTDAASWLRRVLEIKGRGSRF